VSDALVHRADHDRIAVLTLDSPANRNALSRRLVADLTGQLAEAGAERVHLRVIGLSDLDHVDLIASDVLPHV